MTAYRTRLPWFVEEFYKEMDTHPEEYGPDVWHLRTNVIDKAFMTEDLRVDPELAENYFSLETYFPFDLLPYQHCAIGLWACVFRKDNGMPRWPTLFIMGGRGLGKDGVIAFSSFALVSPYNPVKSYDVDICANNEEQAMRPVEDILSVLNDPQRTTKLKRFYRWTKEVVEGRDNKGRIKGRTNNPKGRDGMRSGCIVFNELHEYQNYKNIQVFRTGLGKVDQPRTLMVTTNGDVIGGPLDAYIERAEKILSGEKPDKGWLPFLFRLLSKDDVKDPAKWYQANPRLKHSPSLMYEYQEEFEDYLEEPDKHTSFPTKRMNFRQTSQEVHITKYENIKATNQHMPDLTGHECTCGIDFSKSSDWVGINLHFKIGDKRYDVNHAFICVNGADFMKLECPHKQWEQLGLVTYVNAPDISPDLIGEYVQQAMRKYRIKCIAIDSYRWTIVSSVLLKLGFSLKDKNLKLVRPSDLMKVVPLVDRCFENHYFHWGNNPCLRWATNNAKLVRSTQSKIAVEGNIDTGNFLYGKIEPIKRKTDPFMALVASMTVEDQLTDFKPTTARRRFRAVSY